MTPREVLYALVAIDVPVRMVASTALQLGIASGVGLMLIMQTLIAVRDDREAQWTIPTGSSSATSGSSPSSSSPWRSCSPSGLR